jgi:hypothetical protein
MRAQRFIRGFVGLMLVLPSLSSFAAKQQYSGGGPCSITADAISTTVVGVLVVTGGGVTTSSGAISTSTGVPFTTTVDCNDGNVPFTKNNVHDYLERQTRHPSALVRFIGWHKFLFMSGDYAEEREERRQEKKDKRREKKENKKKEKNNMKPSEIICTISPAQKDEISFPQPEPKEIKAPCFQIDQVVDQVE